MGAVLSMAIGLLVPGPEAVLAADTTECWNGPAWPHTPTNLRDLVFVGHVVPDRFGATRIAVDRVLVGDAPAEVVIVRSCLERGFKTGEQLLVASPSWLADGTGDEPDDLRLWLTTSGGAIWRISPSGRLALAGAGEGDRGFPEPWLARPRFVSDVVSALEGDEAPPMSAYDSNPGDGLPPLRPPTPSGLAWTAVEPETTFHGPLGFHQVISWSGGFAALARARNDVDEDQSGGEVWLSLDGARWRPTMWLPGREEDPEWTRLVGFRDGILAIVRVGLRIKVWHSVDGETWGRLPDLPVLGPPAGSGVAPDWHLILGEPTVSGGRLVLPAAWHYGICGNHCEDFYVWRSWTTDDGTNWTRSRPSKESRRHEALEMWGVVGTSKGFVGLRRGAADDSSSPGCRRGWQLWVSDRGVSWRPVEGTETLCIAPLSLAADPVSDRLLLLGSERDGTIRLFSTTDRRHWEPLEVPFPGAGWNAGSVSVRGDTLVVTGSRDLGEYDTPAGIEGADRRDEPLVSLDGGETWSLSSGWPALLDGLTKVVITDDLILAGATYPTRAVLMETP